MPTEQRHLLFAPAEILTAVRGHLARTGQKLPAGQVVRTGLREAPTGLHYALEVEIGAGAHSIFVIDEAALAAAMIVYCRERSIPLPKQAQKALTKVGDNLGMRISKGAGVMITARRA